MSAAARPERRGREWTLPAGAGLVALETTILISVIAFGSYRAGPALVGFLCLKYVFCWGLVRRRPGRPREEREDAAAHEPRCPVLGA